jgi:hypothetical protein
VYWGAGRMTWGAWAMKGRRLVSLTGAVAPSKRKLGLVVQSPTRRVPKVGTGAGGQDGLASALDNGRRLASLTSAVAPSKRKLGLVAQSPIKGFLSVYWGGRAGWPSERER